MDELVDLNEAARRLGVGPKFPRRLVAERRIRFVKVGRFVRIPASALEEFVAQGTVEPVVRSYRGRIS